MPESEANYDKIFQEVESNIIHWETNLSSFFNEYLEISDSHRLIARKQSQGRPKQIFNSRVGETNRAINTLADVQQRMLTASDPYFEARKLGLNNFGKEMTEAELYGVEAVMQKQLRDFHFKKDLRRSLASLNGFGLIFVDQPWLRHPLKNIESTGFFLKSLIQTAFDPSVGDVEYSDYVGFIDYVTKNHILWMAKSDPETWDLVRVEQAISEFTSLNKNARTDVWSRIVQRKQRAGYNESDMNLPELIKYNGKLDTDNPLLQELYAKNGGQGDIRLIDWTVRSVGTKVVSVSPSPYGTWHSTTKTATINLWELEPIGYSAGRTGKKLQKELDVTQSRINDLLMLAVMNMWKVGRYAGLRGGNIPIVPLGLVELDDITQLEPLRPQIEAIPQGLNMMERWKDDFRTITGAKATLQSLATSGTATQDVINQTEAIRSAEIQSEIIAETLVREHLETMHLNNLHLLDEDVWVYVGGIDQPMILNKDNLPINVGFEVKLTIDKNFRMQENNDLLQILQIITSVRNDVPEGLNLIRPIIEKLVRNLGIDPRHLSRPIPIAEQLLRNLKKQQSSGGIMNELEGEIASEESSQNINSETSTPLGLVPTSPNAELVAGAMA